MLFSPDVPESDRLLAGRPDRVAAVTVYGFQDLLPVAFANG